jgi:alpha-beta hydrolase superfamily lysophospholipase
MERFSLSARDDFKVATARWLPPSRPKAVLQIVHGMAEHASRYERLAQACIEHGIAVYGHDHRGHGNSTDSNTPMGHFADEDGWEKVVSDVQTVNHHVRAVHPGTSVFIFGHSMGAFVARAQLLRDPTMFAGAIISAPGWRMGRLASALARIAESEGGRLGLRTPSKVMTKLVFGSFNLQFLPTRTGFDWISRDRNQVDRYIADPLCGFNCSGTLWKDLFSAVREIERQESDRGLVSCTIPMFIAAGSRDPVSLCGVGCLQLAAKYRTAGNREVTLKFYPGARHELTNETICDEFIGNILEWMERRVSLGAINAA